jgi:hypothetical protein
MLADEIDVKTTSSVLGHALPGVTLAIYGNVLEGGMRAATDRLGARLEKIRDAGWTCHGNRMATVDRRPRKNPYAVRVIWCARLDLNQRALASASTLSCCLREDRRGGAFTREQVCASPPFLFP